MSGDRAVDRRKPGPDYLPQLDSLRAFAVLGVLVTHSWRPEKLPWILAGVDWGDWGVRLFFVLSGFLITRILLGCRTFAEASPRAGLFQIRQFYARRFLRIFPIYYLVIVVVLIANVSPAREVWLWLISYTSNVFIAVKGQWIGQLGHFWTLAVEEQFYLVWPWLVLFAPRRWVMRSTLAAIGLAVLYRVIAILIFPADARDNDFTKGTLAFASLDSLGAGALLALASSGWLGRRATGWVSARRVLPFASAAYLAGLAVYHYSGSILAYFVLGGLGVSGLCYCLVSAASLGIGGRLGAALEHPALVNVGRISYGIYVYHMFIPPLVGFALARVGIVYHESGFLNFALSTALTLLVASASWWLIERPIMTLKRFVRYTPTAPTAEIAPLAAAGAALRRSL